MRSNEADDWAMFSQVELKYEAPHQTPWLVDRRNALIRSVSQRAESQAIKESLLGLGTFVHNALV